MRYLLLLPLILAALIVLGLLLPILRWGFRLAVAAVAALATVLIVPLGEGESWVPFAVFAGTLFLLSVRRRRVDRMTRVEPAPLAREPARSATDPAWDQAWAELRRLAGLRAHFRLIDARAKCERYLTLAATEEHPAANRPIRLREHLPLAIADCVRDCRSATDPERRQLVADLLKDVELTAEQAEQRRRELQTVVESRSRARRMHLTRTDD